MGMKNSISEKIMRVFVIDPNLTSTFGHPIQYCLSISNYCRADNKECIIIANKNIDIQTARLFDNEIFAGISLTSFQNLEQNDYSHFVDLLAIHKKYHICSNDLIIFTSAYTRELNSVSLYLRFLAPSSRPLITLNFHQPFPPAISWREACSYSFQEKWKNLLKASFAQIQGLQSYVSLWTAPCETLKYYYSSVSNVPFKTLPIIFLRALPQAVDIERTYHKIKISFLGDGRFEKGLMLLLDAIYASNIANNAQYFIHNINPRGYTDTEMQALDQLLAVLRTLPEFTIIERNLLPEEIDILIQQTDICVLPYHPLFYFNRASALFVQAVVNAKPVIVPGGTWMAEEVAKGLASGHIFNYDMVNNAITKNNLQQAIRHVIKNYEKYSVKACTVAESYAEKHNTFAYIDAIMRHYFSSTL